ncbi:hypothetical protein TPHA_0M01870 [Tetrapisispora phaffii CBS 4417]|uniref:Uncharacterized protein n=1 Tax=Tetrapisispora phaffii (strain ATCC 24235 / CBS 4417 / NBRC 1672 / NRRL Y-8282 / UCD 70-5) TaxID=1071381 RepID=G8C0P7_TETPH|nr:hypothetical protein TPHA_0M01870 [Tetrapisispora phaffii CBS 4417]CCE65762.1 hypothetical protein TPHA_0M01870 [Tetrapisispora phaffii CBS 4417]
MSLTLLIGSLFAFAYSLIVINRYFSFKLHKNTFPLTLCIISFNMIILLSTTYLLPLDLFFAAHLNDGEGNHNGTMPSINGTLVNEEKIVSFVEHLSLNLLEVDYSEKRLRAVWLSIYWSEFIICWLIIPVLISYVSFKYAVPLGDFRGRLIKAILQNLKFYSISLAVIMAGGVYLVASTGHNLFDFKPLLISLAHIYSLSYALILLSTGLILLPKDLLQQGNLPTESSNNKLFVELSKTNDDLNGCEFSMMENANSILNTEELQNGDITVNELLRSCKLEVNSLLTGLRLNNENRPFRNPSDLSTVAIITVDKLNSTYNKFITHYYNYLYSQTHSNSIIHKLAHVESPYYSNIKRIVLVVIGVICTIASLVVFFMEILPTKWAHGWIFTKTHWYNFGLQFLFLSYTMLVSLYAMSKFKFSNFHLIPNGNSNPSNTLYYSLYSSRLLFPICFNLMTLIPTKNDDERHVSSFESTLYKDISLIPVVNVLNRYAPILFLIIIPLNHHFNLKEKVLMKVLGEEYYYQFFGMMMYEPVEDPNVNQEGDPLEDDSLRRIEEDYAYSLQDGRHLFERASSNYSLTERT